MSLVLDVLSLRCFVAMPSKILAMWVSEELHAHCRGLKPYRALIASVDFRYCSTLYKRIFSELLLGVLF